MGLLPLVIVVSAAAVAVVAVFVFALLRSHGAKSELERRLGVAEERAARTSLVETALRDANEKCERFRHEKEAAEREHAATRETLATCTEALSQTRRQEAEKIALLTDAKERLTEQFKVLAEEVLGRHGETFKTQNKEQLDGLLAPLKQQLSQFQQGLEATHLETTKARASLAEQIRALVSNNQTMTAETRNLTQALKGGSQTQGAWGEMVLATILERSGLRDGEEYVTQESHSTEDGGRLRPDVVVNLPDHKRMVIDSKVSLNAFTDFVNEADPEAKGAHLTRHLASVRAHIKELSAKKYQQLDASGLDYVLMFVPIEGALVAALQADPGLTGYAAELNVALCTPTTLMIALRTVANVWNVERRNRNAEAIADRAGKLYDKFVGFVDDLKAVGAQIDRSRTTYDGAMRKLSTGGGNLVRQVKMLEELGAKTSKSLDPELVEAAGLALAEDAEDVA